MESNIIEEIPALPGEFVAPTTVVVEQPVAANPAPVAEKSQPSW